MRPLSRCQGQASPFRHQLSHDIGFLLCGLNPGKPAHLNSPGVWEELESSSSGIQRFVPRGMRQERFYSASALMERDESLDRLEPGETLPPRVVCGGPSSNSEGQHCSRGDWGSLGALKTAMLRALGSPPCEKPLQGDRNFSEHALRTVHFSEMGAIIPISQMKSLRLRQVLMCLHLHSRQVAGPLYDFPFRAHFAGYVLQPPACVCVCVCSLDSPKPWLLGSFSLAPKMPSSETTPCPVLGPPSPFPMEI